MSNPGLTAPARSGVGLVLILGGVVVILVLNSELLNPSGSSAATLWLAGAGGLGLVSGFTTGNSAQTGTASEFLKFLSAGIVVPMVAGAVTLLEFRTGTTETWTYAGEKTTSHTTSITLPEGYEHFHPLWVLGGFFLMYGIAAVIGAVLGAVLRGLGIEIKMTR
jgi:hypothetical protein